MNFSLKLFIVLLISISVLVSHGLAQNQITIGAKGFTEQHLLAHMVTLILRAHQFEVEEKFGFKTKALRNLFENGAVDLYWEYTGTAYTSILKQTDHSISTDAEKVYETVKKLDQSNDIIWLNKAPLNNSFTLVMDKQRATDSGIESISDLANYIRQNPNLIFGLQKTFMTREDGFLQLSRYYHFEMPYNKLKIVDHPLAYNALQSKHIDVGMGYGTDPHRERFPVKVLKDDRHFFPVYNPAPIIRKETLDKYPKIADWINPLIPLLDDLTISRLIAEVEFDRKTVDQVANIWLKQRDLLP